MIYKKLQIVQEKMKAPKNLYNSFGNFKYRNAESILEAFKPFGAELGLVLVLNDSVEQIGDRTYIKATALLIDIEETTALNYVEVSAYAREPISKKGMDDSQVSGATSSYARKYCLNGLFLLDDTKDADTDEYHKQTTQTEYATQRQISALRGFLKKKGVSEEDALKAAKIKSFDKVTSEQYNTMARLAGDN